MRDITFNENAAQQAWLSIEEEIDKLIQDLRVQITRARPNMGERWNTFKNWLGKAWKTPFNQWHSINPHANEHLSLDEYMLIKEAYQHFESSLNEDYQAPNLDLALSRFKASLKSVFIRHLQQDNTSTGGSAVNPYMAKLGGINPVKKAGPSGSAVNPYMAKLGGINPLNSPAPSEADKDAAIASTVADLGPSSGMTSLDIINDVKSSLKTLGYKPDSIKHQLRRAGAYKQKFDTADELIAKIMGTTIKRKPDPIVTPAADAEPEVPSEPETEPISEPENEPAEPETVSEPESKITHSPASKMAFWTPENQRKFPDLYKQAKKDLGLSDEEEEVDKPSIFGSEKKKSEKLPLDIPTFKSSPPFKTTDFSTSLNKRKTKTKISKAEKKKDKEKEEKEDPVADEFDDDFKKEILSGLKDGEDPFDALESVRIQLPSRVVSEMTTNERIFYHKDLLKTQDQMQYPVVSKQLLESMTTAEKIIYFKNLMH